MGSGPKFSLSKEVNYVLWMVSITSPSSFLLMNMTLNYLLCTVVENYFQCFFFVFILRIALEKTGHIINNLLTSFVPHCREISDQPLTCEVNTS